MNKTTRLGGGTGTAAPTHDGNRPDTWNRLIGYVAVFVFVSFIWTPATHAQAPGLGVSLADLEDEILDIFIAFDLAWSPLDSPLSDGTERILYSTINGTGISVELTGPSENFSRIYLLASTAGNSDELLPAAMIATMLLDRVFRGDQYIPHWFTRAIERSGIKHQRTWGHITVTASNGLNDLPQIVLDIRS